MQNLEISGNSEAIKSAGLEVQQKNNTFLINLECINEKSASPETTVPQEKITSCVVVNQSIGDYITKSSISNVGEEKHGSRYTFTDVMSVVDVCSTQSKSIQTNTVKFEQGKSLTFYCPDSASATKKTMEVVAYK